MSDPLSIAAGVVGLTQAAIQIAKILNKIRQAPEQIAIALREITETSTILWQLQRFLFNVERADRTGAAQVQVDHVIVILSGCVATYSEFEALLDKIDYSVKFPILDRFTWARNEKRITDIVKRLQTHKVSLSLLLTILNGEAMIEMRSSVDQLKSLVADFYQDMVARLPDATSQRIPARSSIAVTTIRNHELDDTESITTIKASNRDRLSTIPTTGWRDFEVELRKSRAYRRITFEDPSSAMSFNETHTTTWSCFTGVSLSNISQISVISLVTLDSEIYNNNHYTSTPGIMKPGRSTRYSILDSAYSLNTSTWMENEEPGVDRHQATFLFSARSLVSNANALSNAFKLHGYGPLTYYAEEIVEVVAYGDVFWLARPVRAYHRELVVPWENLLLGWVRRSNFVPLIGEPQATALETELNMDKIQNALIVNDSANPTLFHFPGIFEEELDGLASATLFLDIHISTRVKTHLINMRKDVMLTELKNLLTPSVEPPALLNGHLDRAFARFTHYIIKSKWMSDDPEYGRRVLKIAILGRRTRPSIREEADFREESSHYVTTQTRPLSGHLSQFGDVQAFIDARLRAQTTWNVFGNSNTLVKRLGNIDSAQPLNDSSRIIWTLDIARHLLHGILRTQNPTKRLSRRIRTPTVIKPFAEVKSKDTSSLREQSSVESFTTENSPSV